MVTNDDQVRIPLNRLAMSVTVLGSGTPSFPALLLDLKPTSLCMSVDRELRRGCLLKVLWERALLIGEVIGCRPERDKFLATMDISESMCDLDGFQLATSQ